jgi:hypothetical protein
MMSMAYVSISRFNLNPLKSKYMVYNKVGNNG